MPKSLVLDPRTSSGRHRNHSGQAGRPLMVAMHGWSYDERHLFTFTQLFPGEIGRGVGARTLVPRRAAGRRGDGQHVTAGD